MRALKTLWRACERLFASGVLKEWEISVQDPEDFAVARRILVPTDRVATHYPCTDRPRCSCDHEVWTHGDGSKVAFCICDDGECDAVPVTDEDLIIYEVDFPRVFRAIGRAAGFDVSMREAPGVLGVRSVGECRVSPGCATPIYFAPHWGADGLTELIRDLASLRSGPFVLFTITSDVMDARAREVADRLGLLVMHLEELVLVGDDGALGVDTRVRGALAAYLERVSAERSGETVSAALSGDVFRETNGYHTIVLRGIGMPTLTDLQADVARVLHTAVLEGEGELSYDVIACRVADFHADEIGFAPPAKMSYIFRSRDPRGKLVRRTKPGFYRLNI